MLQNLLVFAILIPGGISLVVLALTWRVWRKGAGPGAPWAAPLALGAAFLAGQAGVQGWPGFPPVEAIGWIFFLAAGAALWGIGDSLWRPPAWAQWLARPFPGSCCAR
jgi:hypothetical protein